MHDRSIRPIDVTVYYVVLYRVATAFLDAAMRHRIESSQGKSMVCRCRYQYIKEQ